MADVAFTRGAFQIEGDIYLATPLTSTNVATGILSMNEGQDEVTVQILGTVDSATVVVQGSLDGTNFATLNDWNGNAMSYTAIGIIRRIGPPVTQLKVSTSGGGGSQSISVAVYIVRKVRP
jgi:hypothetical protein